VAHLREPRLVTLPPQRVLLVTARGDPNTVGKKAFGQLMRTYFALKGVPNIADQGYEIAGPHEEEYLRGPGMLFAGDPEGYLTLIRYEVRRKTSPSEL
jgi:hypothetical protein